MLMTTTQSFPALHLEAPGPGPWEQDTVHFSRPATRYFQDTHPPAFKAGTQFFARHYGMLIDGLQIAYVQGFAYNQKMPAPAADVPGRMALAPSAVEPLRSENTIVTVLRTSRACGAAAAGASGVPQ